MKEIGKFTFNENIVPLNEQELKTILGGYGAGTGCKAHQSSCSGSCTTSTGISGTCSTIEINGTTLCACYS